ncbi:MAG TPA: protease modulator HflC [Acidiferrobacteraceae bacterium]|nr:protease modulator HflC [Acidiferrobacteraceae bacterium]HEX19243.1 protease modulator HflC [Acidiferrobacteraceae bacterium]
MNQKVLIAILIVILIAVPVVSRTFFTVHETQKALVIRFGKVDVTRDKPGLYMKDPFFAKVRYFDSRLLTMDFEPRQILTGEKKYVIVDSFVKWRIDNPLTYFLATGTGLESEARKLLEPLINEKLRGAFGDKKIREVVSADRVIIMKSITKIANKKAKKIGITVVDVRIKRIDLPDEISESVFKRMRSERLKIAKALRAEGGAEAEKIRAEAEKEKRIILATAFGKAERTKGDGDKKAAALYSQAYRQHPEFYAFYRSLEAYEASFKDQKDILILDPNTEFFKYFKKMR